MAGRRLVVPVEVVNHFPTRCGGCGTCTTIKDANGQKQKFYPNWAQEDFLLSMWFLNLVLKSRQLGFTTVIVSSCWTRSLFNPHLNARVIADSDAKAKEIFDDKIRFAYDSLPFGLLRRSTRKSSRCTRSSSRTSHRSRWGPARGA
jgi:hypothetical protein